MKLWARVISIIIFFAVMAFLLSMRFYSESTGGAQEVMNNDLVTQFQKAMDANEFGDGQSVYYEDGTVKTKDDPLDRPDVIGEFGFGVWRRLEREDWSADVPFSDKAQVLQDEPNRYVIRDDSRLVEVCRVAYQDADLSLSAEFGMRKIDILSTSLSNVLKNRYKKAELFRGLREYDGNVLAGYVIALEDFFEHTYQIACFGTGNMSWIYSDAYHVFQSFTIEFDIEQWIENQNAEE